jgi:hypothetical protein
MFRKSKYCSLLVKWEFKYKTACFQPVLIVSSPPFPVISRVRTERIANGYAAGALGESIQEGSNIIMSQSDS